MTDPDDIFALCGVELPEAKVRTSRKASAASTAPVRHTEWNNLATFTFGGWVARLTRQRCEVCEAVTEVFGGVFVEEVHRSGTRRLTALAPKGDWPQGGGHRLEVTEETTRMCGGCVRELGFSREVGAEGPFTLLVGRAA